MPHRQVLAITNESCFYRAKQGIKGLPPLSPAPQIPAQAPPLRSGQTTLRGAELDEAEHFLDNHLASVASLRRLFAFTGTPFGFPLESPLTFTGIPKFCSAFVLPTT